MLEPEARKKAVDTAHTWLRTPYHHYARIKGAGVDCLTLLAEVYAEAGIIPPVDIPQYSHQWHLNRDEEKYLNGLLKYTREIFSPPQPGDIVVWKFARCFAHGAIVVQWPMVIHAYMGRGCVLEDAEKAEFLQKVGEERGGMPSTRPRKFFSFWGK